ncbi:MAG: Iodothyronine deiodinase [Planctomycetaceae bacterium]|nr:Iodothyronine deiodinase [Planctomycetaceae bacterium]
MKIESACASTTKDHSVANTSAGPLAGSPTVFPLGPELMDIPLDEIEQAYAGTIPPEGIRMYLLLARGLKMGSGLGWYGPCQSRFSWAWLAARHGIELDSVISAAQFQGPPEWFQRLDRNQDAQITAEDLDWSDHNPWLHHAYAINRLFRKIESNGDGRLTREDWHRFFEMAAGGKDEVTLEELREAWLSGFSSTFMPGDAPMDEALLDGLFNGELGSMQEGPALDAAAPDFQLTTFDGQRSVRLSEVTGSKPVVLVFGNFTCGPFRAMYPSVDQVYQRFKQDAEFLAIYVREAHPVDGWHMCSNEKVGVKVFQPKTYEERISVAGQCHRLLKPSMPLLVDDIHDTTGHAYSGMPARLYVLDTQGRIAYKAGRGPFGFKIGEMEQALVMALMQ